MSEIYLLFVLCIVIVEICCKREGSRTLIAALGDDLSCATYGGAVKEENGPFFYSQKS